ncbi:MAG TPA: methyltransferase domain-containing protein, partial [Acidimicrobiia bacterium]
MSVIPGRRQRLAAFLSGRGLELGPGHVPFDVPPGLEITFVDRWEPEQHADLFPDLPGATFIKPDVIANFDTDRLTPIADASQDFVICSHVLEHLAEPIGFVAEIYRVLRPGGIALILLP